MTRTIQAVSAAAVLCTALLLPGTVRAQNVDNECVTGCLTTARECNDAARSDFEACAGEAGCDDLLATAKEVCEADRESEECEAARDASRECAAPCKEELHAAKDACRDASRTCLSEQCGLPDLPELCRGARRGGGHGPRH